MTTAFWLEKAQENLSAAELLYEQHYYDIAASRAYYAMFYAAQAALLTKNLTFTKHSAVIAAFGKEFAKTGEIDPKLHRYLTSAQEARNLGDYGSDVYIPAEEAERLIGWAKEFLNALQDYLSR